MKSSTVMAIAAIASSVLIGAAGIAAAATTATGTLTVKVKIASKCEVDASALDFGTQGALIKDIEGKSNLGISCTLDTPYVIGFVGGDVRTMVNGTSKISYSLFSDKEHKVLWGDIAANPADASVKGNQVASKGTGKTQSIPVYGLILATGAAEAPVAGDYSDTVTVNVTY